MPDFRTEIRAATCATFRDDWREAFTIRRRRPVSVWATEERRLAPGQSPLSSGVPIRYVHDVMPHAVEPMAAADDPSVNIIVLWFARRMAKTEGVCANTFGRTITDDPGNIYSMWPVEDSLERFSRDVIEPMIEHTPALDRVFVEKRSRDTGRTVAYKRFRGGSLYLVNAGSPSKMRGMAAKVVSIHEVDAFPGEVGVEGDPVEKALGRAEGFGDAIKIIESTGTIAPGVDEEGNIIYRSRIHKWYDRGDQRKWFCQCHDCGRLQWLKFAQILYPEGRMDMARYVCERCRWEHDERQWRELVLGGKWFPTAGLKKDQLEDIEANFLLCRPLDPVVRSYWINGFNSLLPTGKGYATKLHQFVAEHDRVKDDPKTLRVWINEVDTGLWDSVTGTEPPPPIEPLLERREDYGTPNGLTVPSGALVLTAAVDVQLDRLEVKWKAWSPKEETWLLEVVVIPGSSQGETIWRKLRTELGRKFQRADGVELSLSMALVDAGKWPDWVLWFLRHIKGTELAGKVRACRGSSNYPHPVIDTSYVKLAKGTFGHWVGGDAAKDIIYARLRRERNGSTPEAWQHFPMTVDEQYFGQLTSERVTVKIMRGKEERRYTKPDGRRNEALDLEVYNLAAFRLRRWNFDAIEAELRQQAEEKRNPTHERQKPVENFLARPTFQMSLP